jgi:hypothetical protein
MEHHPSRPRPSHPTLRAFILMVGLLLVIVGLAYLSSSS